MLNTQLTPTILAIIHKALDFPNEVNTEGAPWQGTHVATVPVSVQPARPSHPLQLQLVLF